MTRLILTLCLLLAPQFAPAHAQPSSPQLELPRVTLTAGMHLIQAVSYTQMTLPTKREV